MPEQFFNIMRARILFSGVAADDDARIALDEDRTECA
jgi:hypothetical protein